MKYLIQVKAAVLFIVLILVLNLNSSAQDTKTSKKARKGKAEREMIADSTTTEKPVKKTRSPQQTVKVNTYTDIYQMIRQEVPGVVVSGRNIVVQGPNSFFGSSQPLFLVNGHRVSSIDNINPLEVKSIRLLKGSYANIYGSEGANGVISITLLNGSEKK